MFSSYDALCTALFAPSALASAMPQGALAAVGKGCAKAVESYCNRSFALAYGRVEYAQAFAFSTQLNAQPIYGFPTVELQDFYREGDTEPRFINVLNRVAMFDRQAGIVHWKSRPGSPTQQLRITYDGGYWIDMSAERKDTPPDGLTPLPEDIHTAWINLCEEVWTRHQQRLLTTPDSNLTPKPTEFPQIVRDLLAPYRLLARF